MRYLLPALAFLAMPLDAQSCFRGRPAPTCRQWFITEAFGGFVTGRGDTWTVGGEVGWMRNRGPGSALGLGVAVTNIGVSVRPRYRRWIENDLALDIGPGLQWVPGRVERLELNAQVMYHDRLGAWATGLLDAGTRSAELAGGLRLGAEPGVTAYVAGLLSAVGYLIWWTRNVD